MSDTTTEHGNVIQLRAAETASEAQFEGTEAPAYLDTTDTEAVRRLPIMPVALRRENLRGTITQQAGLRWHQARYHGLRSPAYLLTYLWHALRGAGRLTASVLMWWHWTEGWALESQAVAAGRAGHHEAMHAHVEGKKTRAARGRIVAFCLTAAAVAVGLVVMLAPPWILGLLAAAVVAALARAGRPDGRQVIRPAVVTPVYQPPTPEVITRALGSLRDVKVVRELHGVLSTHGADQALLVAWGGVNKTAKQELRNQFFKVRVWGADELLGALTRTYSALDDDIRAELPLKQIWALVEEAE